MNRDCKRHLRQHKQHSHLMALFSLAVFLIMTITMAIISTICMVLTHFGLLQRQSPAMLLVAFVIVSIVLGTIFSRIIGKRPVKAIARISAAAKEVAKGNFDIVLEEDYRVEEIGAMAHNFNIMTKELKSTEILRSDFVSNVSHEFKTPLAAIEGYATLLQNKSLDEEKQAAYISKIIYNTRRLSNLTGNILELSRLENQDITVDKKLFSLDEQIREIILMYEMEWNKKQLELDIELENLDYFGNEEMLAQVWQNLIGNAIKFVSPKGLVRVLMKTTDAAVEIAVVDDGCGMEEETQKRVFEKFYQGDVSRSAGGNGLGLALAKRIVELHAGTIAVSSKKDKGTTLKVTLPR